MCELMARERLPEPHAERARLAHDAVRLLGSIIDDILDFSKLEAGRMELESVEMSPRRVLEDSVAMFREDAAAKGLELALDCGPGLPDSAYADPLRLRQILNNLVGNAIKFTERGSVRVRADAEPLQGGWELRVEVADTGIGLAPGARERLFQAFSQADATTTRRYGGTGLGLAISRQLVEMMGGAIAADGEPGQGSRFVFRVRLSAACALPERRTSARAAPAPDLAGRRVLVVEDNPVNRKVAADQLAQFGCAVELAEDGRKALEAFARAPFDLVLMDCQMPVMDGYAAAAELRRREPPGERVPIVAMTAGGSSAEIERCRESGMDDCLIKPVGLEALAEALGRWAAPVDASALAAAAQTLSAASASWREDYLSDAKRLLDQAAAALARGRRDELRRAAHTLKGSSAALGARRLGRLAAALEAAESPSAAAIDEARAELARVERAVS
jgi:CheY-like chemotaxis protein